MYLNQVNAYNYSDFAVLLYVHYLNIQNYFLNIQDLFSGFHYLKHKHARYDHKRGSYSCSDILNKKVYYLYALVIKMLLDDLNKLYKAANLGTSV